MGWGWGVVHLCMVTLGYTEADASCQVWTPQGHKPALLLSPQQAALQAQGEG